MVQAVQFSRSFWLPLATGLAWILCGEAAGLFGLALALPPAFLCFASSFFGLQPPESERADALSALGGAVGLLLGVLSLFFYGVGMGIVLLGLSAWTFLDAGTRAAETLEPVEGIPAPEPGLVFNGTVALDEAMLGMISFMAPMPSRTEPPRIEREVAEAMDLFEAKGWLEKPEEYHRVPLPLEVPHIRPASVRTLGGRVDYEALSFESEYEPHADEPGRDRWLGYLPNRTAHAHVLRHPGPPRPWLVCIHGYQMGKPTEDFGAFDSRLFHRKYGFNLVMPTLPLHGPRKIGRFSGDGFMSGDVLDSIHGETQGLWDIRRILSWVRAQEAPSIGVYGLSLGGYTASMLTGIETGLDFVIAGIPMTSLSATYWDHLPDHVVRMYLECGLTLERLEQVTQVVSPIHVAPKVPKEGRAIFGGVGDRLVSADQVVTLARHWEEPATAWYQGSHMTFLFDPTVRELIENTVRRSAAPARAGAA